VNYIIVLAFLLFVIVYGSQLAWTSRARSFQGIPWISYSWVTASLPFGALLMMMTTIVKFIDLRRSGPVASSAA
jgi:TRAP-type C4-dicarboxylate transport system permease small subunit